MGYRRDCEPNPDLYMSQHSQCLSLSLFVYICLCLSLSVSSHLCLSLSVVLSLYLFLCIFICLFYCLCIIISLSVCLCPCLSVCRSLYPSLSLSFSQLIISKEKNVQLINSFMHLYIERSNSISSALCLCLL